jgi:molecular chaperone DnaK
MVGPTRQALEDARLQPSEIDRVILVGGSTRMPAVQDMVREMFNKEPHKGTNPDEVVALGAAIQAGVLGGEVRDIVLLDVTPLSLGIETLGGVMTRLIPRNTTIPTSAAQVFTTASDGQTAVQVKVYQGEREMASANKLLGDFQLAGIPPAPRGVPKVEVTFEIDANGIVKVSARDQATGKAQQITITASSGLTKDEIDRMVRDAEMHAEEDRRRREEQEARNHADSLLYNAEKTIREAEGKVDANLITTAREAATSLRAALNEGNASAIREQSDALTTATYVVSTALYQQGGGSPAPPPTTPPSGGFDPDAAYAANGDAEAADGAERTAQFTDDDLAGAATGRASEEDVVEGEFREER